MKSVEIFQRFFYVKIFDKICKKGQINLTLNHEFGIIILSENRHVVGVPVFTLFWGKLFIKPRRNL